PVRDDRLAVLTDMPRERPHTRGYHAADALQRSTGIHEYLASRKVGRRTLWCEAAPTGYDRRSMRVDAPGRFEVLEPVGSGGTAAVYRARDSESGAQVALKLMRGLSELDARRLDREATALASVAHDGIVGYVAHG